MIERYTRPEMQRVWSDETRLRRMLEVELAFLKVLAREKRIPAPELEALRRLLDDALAEQVKSREAKSGHEVVGLLQAVSAQVKEQAPQLNRYLHYGLTSSDVLDTAFSLQLVEANGLILEGWKRVADLIRSLAARHRRTWMVGRTHGVHAEPITFGVKLAGWHAEALRNLERIERARETASYGKISGAVGTFAHFPPAFEAEVCRQLGLKPEPVSTQVVPRDRYAECYHAWVLSAAAIERFAVEIRHLQRTEVLELEEPFTEDQKGSSAMPHKRNPVLCENLTGLSRLIRSYESAVVENCVLWHERDISHSSAERIIFPDAAIALHFMLHRMAQVLEGLQVYPDRMQENLERSLGLVFSQKVLLQLIDSGLGRLEAYELVQRNAMKTWKTRRPFVEMLLADQDVTRNLPPVKVKACFDVESYSNAVEEILRRGGVEEAKGPERRKAAAKR
jgi:adenylosuccinate lyase